MTQDQRDSGAATEALAVVTGWITCRLVDEQALIHCKQCGLGQRVNASPRPDFLQAVRSFIRVHEHRPA